MEDELDVYMCPSCGEDRDVEQLCNSDGSCDFCQESSSCYNCGETLTEKEVFHQKCLSCDEYL